MKKLSLLALLVLFAFACEKPEDEQPIELNEQGLMFCIVDENGEGCEDHIEDPIGGGGPGGGNNGGGNNGGNALPSGNYITYVHKGDATDRIWYQSTTNNGTSWTPNGDIVVQTPGGGTSTPQTSKEPAITYANNKLFVYYKGKSTDRIFYSHRDNYDVWEGNGWVIGSSNIETPEAPSAVTSGGVVYLTYKEKGSNRIVLRTSTNGINFSDAFVLTPSGSSAFTAPFVTKSPNGNIHIFFTGGGSVSHQQYAPSVLTGNPANFTPLGGSVGAIADAGTAVSADFKNNTTFVLAYGAGEDKVLTVYEGTAWSGTEYVVPNSKTDKRPAVKWLGFNAMVTFKEYLDPNNNVFEDEDIRTKFSSPAGMNLTWVGGDSGGNSRNGGVQSARYTIN